MPIIYSVLMFLIFLLAPVFGYGVAAGEEEIVVFVAASLTDAVKEVKERFEARSGARVSLNPGASGTLLHQIEAGAPADVFISASTKEVDALELDGLALPDTRRELLTNKLVVVASVGSGLEINSARDLAGREVKRIAIGEPESVPVGRYAREALRNLGLWDSLYPRLVSAPDVRAVLDYVERGVAKLGVVYKTDAMVSKRLEVVFELPEDSYTKIIYPAVVLKRSEGEKTARDFVNFLSSMEALEVFERFGFEVLGGH